MSQASLTPILLPADPTLPLHAASMQYADGHIAGKTIAVPAVGQDKLFIYWDNGAGAWAYGKPAPIIYAPSYAATLNVNGTGYDEVRIPLSGPCTINMTGGVDGQRLLLALKQDATGNRAVTLGTGFLWGTDIPSYTTPTLSATKTDLIGLVYVAASSAYRVVAIARGY